MKFCLATVAFLACYVASAHASFARDVVGASDEVRRQADVKNEIMQKAMPLEEYRRHLRSHGYDIPQDETASRALNEDGNGEGDDYYMDANEMFSFSGYSLKYAKCQPVQSFSEAAIQAGEATPMITEDIVVLRLCPYRFCSSSITYGCHYNYADYAIALSDYVRIMIRFTEDKKEELCEWCQGCGARRQLEGDGDQNQEGGGGEENNDREGNDNEQGEDNADQNAGEEDGQNDEGENQQDQNNDEADGDDENGGDDDCADYGTYCYDDNGYSICQEEDDGSYMALDGYLDYLYCTKIQDEEQYSYYVRPRCNGKDGTFKMDIFHDQFCSQYAGKDKSLKEFGLGFQSSVFEPFYSSSCMDCSESNYPPNFESSSNMCNRIHASGARCTQNLQYELFDGEDQDSSTECSFIESLRMGTYDDEGKLYVEGYALDGDRTVTLSQKIGLGLTIGIVAILSLYSCYLHHSITNLLIKSLSHTELLGTHHHSSSRRGRHAESPGGGKRRSSSRNRGARRSFSNNGGGGGRSSRGEWVGA